jgi:hypothetical protein
MNTKSSEIKTKTSCSEAENIQNEKRLICEQMHNNYFNQDLNIHIYLIPMSDPYLRERLANALIIDNQTQNFDKIIDDTLEDGLVWIKLSDLCDRFLKQSINQSQNSPVAKSVAVILSLL